MISVRQISAMQLKKFYRKGCQLYAAHILEPTGDEDYQVLQEFKDVFSDEIPRLPPKRDIDFTIELVPEAAPMSKTPYRMSTQEILEPKMQVQELLEKSILGRVCLLGEHRFCL